MSITANLTTSASTDSSSPARTGTQNSVMSKDDFLKLLVAQLKNQDPTSPMDSAQFVAQMADFTTLEQTQNMGTAIDKLVASQEDSTLSSKATMIGKRIQWEQTVTDPSGNQVQAEVNGIVQAVTIKNGQISYVTDDGKKVDPSSLTEVSEPSTDQGA
ncbi:flagellar hook capping protein [Sporolactobacillus sp. THM7-4]|nr:flagellar hook capping protein [Sporolactobacillus sp. THM7-4]